MSEIVLRVYDKFQAFLAVTDLPVSAGFKQVLTARWEYGHKHNKYSTTLEQY